MLARASADVRLRPGDLIGSGTVGTRLPARGPGRDARSVSRAGRRRHAPDRPARRAPDADRGAAAMTAVDPARATVPVSPALPPGSTRRVSSSISTWSRRMRAGWRTGRPRAASPSALTPRPTRASRSPGCSSRRAPPGSPSARSARPRSWSTAGSTTSSSATRSGPTARRRNGSGSSTSERR